jgi:hypothetical protein
MSALTSRVVGLVFAIALGAGAVPPRDSAVEASRFDAARFLATAGQFSQEDLQALERREVVVRLIEADPSEIAICAAVLIDVTPEFFRARFLDIETFRDYPEVAATGRFDRRPEASDLAGVTLEPRELAALRKCRVGDCGLKLDAAGLAALPARQRDEDLTMALRHHLAAHAAAYIDGGDAALMTYSDRKKPVDSREELRRIFERSSYLREQLPDVLDHVVAPPRALPSGVEQLLYWSIEAAGTRPVLSMTHALAFAPRPDLFAITTKQLYASHYFTASLGTTLLVRRTSGGVPRLLLIYLNRSRLDLIGGPFAGLKRAIVRKRARPMAERVLQTMRQRLEDEFAQSGGEPR